MPIIEKPSGIPEMEVPHQPYSSVVKVGNHFYFSGVVAIDENGEPDGSPKEQIGKVFVKMKELLKACGLTLNDVFSAFVYFAPDMKNRTFFNARWEHVFRELSIKPRRSVVAVNELPFGCAVEIVFDAVK